jgi:hypothetical protein
MGIWVLAPWLGTYNIIRGKGLGFKGLGFFQVHDVVNLVNPCLPMSRTCTKMVLATH